MLRINGQIEFQDESKKSMLLYRYMANHHEVQNPKGHGNQLIYTKYYHNQRSDQFIPLSICRSCD